MNDKQAKNKLKQINKDASRYKDSRRIRNEQIKESAEVLNKVSKLVNR